MALGVAGARTPLSGLSTTRFLSSGNINERPPMDEPQAEPRPNRTAVIPMILYSDGLQPTLRYQGAFMTDVPLLPTTPLGLMIIPEAVDTLRALHVELDQIPKIATEWETVLHGLSLSLKDQTNIATAWAIIKGCDIVGLISDSFGSIIELENQVCLLSFEVGYKLTSWLPGSGRTSHGGHVHADMGNHDHRFSGQRTKLYKTRRRRIRLQGRRRNDCHPESVVGALPDILLKMD